MKTFEEITKIIDEEIAKINWTREPRGLYEPIDYVLSLGGKRIRPALVLAGCEMFSGNLNEAIAPALGIEIFHNFTLLHDDIMDKADIRRGKPTVHKKWNDNTAILSGDVMQIAAYQYIAKTKTEFLKEVLDLFSTTAMEICEGQQLDMEFETRPDVSADEYLEMIRLKTAVLLGAALKIGAIIGGANETDKNLLYDFGVNLGLAFQLKDDLLDVYGDADTFGKKIGGDIICNKKTFLLISALQKADGNVKKELLNWLEIKEFDADEKIKSVRKIYDLLEIRNICETKIDIFSEKALKKLNKINLPIENKQIILNLAENLKARKR